MEKRSKGVRFAELAGRTLARALGWLLVLAGVLGVLATLVVYLGDYPGKSPVLSAVSFVACLLVIAGGVYGNPRFRERIRASL
ncbi:hypothetical protein [Halostella litorea]|uniref:hypothetical protein n=1 Tax=Halostella litorea TaxID=2528831 RepID=UPI001092FEF1|nr:hypothetical protein [Halostella litorea]